MSEYLDPTNDVSFKKLFSSKARLINFLNSFLNLSQHPIIDLDYIEQPLPLDKGIRSIFDLRVKDSSKRLYAISIQPKVKKNYLYTLQFYSSYYYATQLEVFDSNNTKHKDLSPIVLISIIGDKIFDNDIPCVSYHNYKNILNQNKEEEFYNSGLRAGMLRSQEVLKQACDEESHMVMNDKYNAETENKLFNSYNYVFIELEKYQNISLNTKKPISDKQQWLHLLKYSTQDKKPPKSITNQLIIEAYNILKKSNWSTADYDAYMRSKLAQKAEYDSIEAQYEAGIEHGMSLGETQGLRIGRVQGMKIRNIEIACNMLRLKISPKLIAEITGLSIENIMRLQDKL